MNSWLCSRCGKEPEDHTLREIHGGCTQPLKEEESKHPWTATEYGRVSPEAFDDTGEEFDLKRYENLLTDHVVRSQQRIADKLERVDLFQAGLLDAKQ